VHCVAGDDEPNRHTLSTGEAQQLAAIRGAVNGLLAEVLESHLREKFGDAANDVARSDSIEQAIALVRSYLK
jgi:FrmR/RcnR family transcriptional regulator, repressor of frmRAB operon